VGGLVVERSQCAHMYARPGVDRVLHVGLLVILQDPENPPIVHLFLEPRVLYDPTLLHVVVDEK
jgi:hypothetical protein